MAAACSAATAAAYVPAASANLTVTTTLACGDVRAGLCLCLRASDTGDSECYNGAEGSRAKS